MFCFIPISTIGAHYCTEFNLTGFAETVFVSAPIATKYLKACYTSLPRVRLPIFNRIVCY